MDAFLDMFDRAAAVGPLLMAALALWMLRRLWSGRGPHYSPAGLLLATFGLAAGLFSALNFAYHLALGHPIEGWSTP